MTEQEQIEEMAMAISNYADKHDWELHEPELEDLAIELYNAEYRKVDEVRKETAKDICDWLEYRFKLYDYVIEKPVKDSIKVIRKKYGVGVKE